MTYETEKLNNRLFSKCSDLHIGGVGCISFRCKRSVIPRNVRCYWSLEVCQYCNKAVLHEKRYDYVHDAKEL